MLLHSNTAELVVSGVLCALVVVVVLLIRMGINKLKRWKNRLTYQAETALMRELSPYAKDMVTGIMDAVKDETPAVRSTGGCTSVCLEKVQKDFKDFHAEDANTDIQTFILEYLKIKYSGQQDFVKAKVSDRVLIQIGDRSTGTLSGVKINQIAISDYQKSLDAATLRYRVSVGFQIDSGRKEKLYEVEYTLQLRDEYDTLAYIKCTNCGAPLSETDGTCPYCGMKHVRDTISSWVVTDVLEK